MFATGSAIESGPAVALSRSLESKVDRFAALYIGSYAEPLEVPGGVAANSSGAKRLYTMSYTTPLPPERPSL